MSSAQATTNSPPSSPEKDFFAFGEDYVKSPEHIPATIESIDFDGLLDNPLLLHQDLAAGCGGMLWPAGMRMAKYLLKMKRDEMKNAESMCVLAISDCPLRLPPSFSRKAPHRQLLTCVFSVLAALNSELEAVWSGESATSNNSNPIPTHQNRTSIDKQKCFCKCLSHLRPASQTHLAHPMTTPCRTGQ